MTWTTRAIATEAATLVGLLMATGAAAAPPGTLPFGVYDPAGDFSADGDVTIEHLFLPWEDVSLESLVAADEYAKERDRVLLITVEPWTWTRDERNTPDFLRNGILTGYYDANMRGICQVLDTLETPVTVRWGHEMEYVDGQFIWAGWSPEDYVTAYRRMVDVCREVAPRVNYMWSPLGMEGLDEYYPGDDYVDLVGLSIFGFQAYDEHVYGAPRDYMSFLTERYDLVAKYNKPVVIAELGYTGCEDYVEQWDAEVREPRPDLNLLVGVVYFDQQEVYPWPDGFGLPDWRVEHRVTDEDGGCGVQPMPAADDLLLDEFFEK